MSTDLFSSSAATADFVARAISPKRELGAYEALWAREGAWFKSIAEDFRAHAGAIPSDFGTNYYVNVVLNRILIGEETGAGNSR